MADENRNTARLSPQVSLAPISILADFPFEEAATAWLESRRHHISPRTFLDYSRYIELLAKYFREMRIPEITGDQMRAYQHKRREKACPSTINKELDIIVMIRERLNCPLTDYQRLPNDKSYEPPGMALEEMEEQSLLRVCNEAADHSTWDVAALRNTALDFYGPRSW